MGISRTVRFLRRSRARSHLLLDTIGDEKAFEIRRNIAGEQVFVLRNIGREAFALRCVVGRMRRGSSFRSGGIRGKRDGLLDGMRSDVYVPIRVSNPSADG